jgi:hypothetical protein
MGLLGKEKHVENHDFKRRLQHNPFSHGKPIFPA